MHPSQDTPLADMAPLRDALQDRYALERELGRGGMATVYLARDVKHKRQVALKVLHPELAAALGAERFQREIEFAARLQHPHILTVLDSGEAAGQLWFTMPYVEGESLRSLLRRERQLPVDEALRIATETARALDYAHRQGVMHRDIKPENILLTRDGDTLVADFGIARALAGSEDHLTDTGMSLGTPAYMSPEQASGDKAVDARTDMYSLGCVLYEMLAGEPPYTGPNAQVIIMKRFTEPVPSVRKIRPAVPEGVDQAIQRALASLPADRFATAAEFGRTLQVQASALTTAAQPAGPPPGSATAGPAVAASAAAPTPTTPVPSVMPARRPRMPIAAITLGLGFLIGIGVLFAWRHTHASTTEEAAGSKRIAVLPFENLGDSADAYFADGMTDEVRGKLSHVAGLAVIARTSSNEYRKTTKLPQQVARELGADYLLTATVRWEKVAGGPSRVRVSPELIRVQPGAAPTTKWQQGFDASLTDVFQVQADIATKVASALDVAMGDSARHQLAVKPTANLAAYDAFLKGEAVVEAEGMGNPGSLRQAIGLYEQAVTLDSTFVSAWAQLARARSALYFISTPTPDLATQARKATDRAQALGPDQPEAKRALGDYYGSVLLDNRQALAAYEAGLKLAPNNVDLLGAVASTEQSLNRWDTSLPLCAKAAELDPRSASAQRRLAFALMFLRRYREAQIAMDRALPLGPTNFDNILRQVMLALAEGDLSGAQAFVRKTLTVVDPTSLIPFLAIYQDLYWVLDDAQQRQLLTFPLSAFDNDPGTRATVLAQTYQLRGNLPLARLYADSARLALEEQLRGAPGDGQRHVFRGLALAYMGRKAEAIEEGKRGVALWPISRDAYNGAYVQHQLVRIYLLVGEPEKALDQLEPLLKMPYYLSPGWLRIDPTFAPLKGNPRFEKLIATN